MDEQSNNQTTEQSNNSQERYPLTNEHLFVITELAKLGLAYLKLALPEFAKEQDGAGKAKRDTFAHLKSLYEVAGPETVKHFDEICQYLYDQANKAQQKA